MNRSDRGRPSDPWRRLTLWPRLALGVTVGFLLLFAGFSLLGIHAVDASTNRILHERLAVTEELAEDIDGVLAHRFANLAAYDARPAAPAVRRRLLDEIFRSSGGAFTSLIVLGPSGRVVASIGRGAAARGTDLAARPDVARLLSGSRRVVSAPFRDDRGRPVVALGVRVGTPSAPSFVIGTFDLTGPDVMQRLASVRELTPSGHAELVGPGGIQLASTETSAALSPGEHLAFYRSMLAGRAPRIADVPVTPGAAEPSSLRGTRHVMAFARLHEAPWGVAVGATKGETYAPANRLRRTLILAGGGALAALWLLTLLAARLLVRPVQELTGAAERMAAGDLDESVAVTEGGEIGVLAESLETMRVQLKESLETVRRWGEDLELKVGERTSELNARNRQLAAVSAILAVANETHDIEPMLERSLDVVLEQTGAEAAAVTLADGPDSPSVVVRGALGGFPVADGSGSLPAGSTSDGVTVLPLRGPAGLLGALTLGFRDRTTPSADDERVLGAMADQLAATVEHAQLESELGRLEATQEVQRMRSELISAVSHELRTPLGFIKGYATTLLRDDTPIDPDTRRRFLHIIDEETEKLEHMIEELLDASRLQAGRLPVERVPVALDALVTHTVERARPSLEEGGHRVTTSLPAGESVVLADPVRIEQVLDNLLENASRYSDPGSPVEVVLEASAADALLAVSNMGEGVDAGELEQIFEPFHRGANAGRRRVHGAGLGLAISRGIVEAHGGRIWCESGDGRVTFLVRLPRGTA